MGWDYYSTYAYRYDPDTILTYKDIDGKLVIEGDNLYLIRRSTVFGTSKHVIFPASVSNNVLTAQEIGTEIWWQEIRNDGKDPLVLPPFTTCTLQDFGAERISGDTVEPVTIPEGTDVYPLYTIMDESGNRFFYFRTTDYGDCRASYTIDDDGYTVMFGDVNQTDLFYCEWGD